MSGRGIYCPTCARTIEPCNTAEVEAGEESDYLYVHDDIAHDDDDIAALEAGIQ